MAPYDRRWERWPSLYPLIFRPRRRHSVRPFFVVATVLVIVLCLSSFVGSVYSKFGGGSSRSITARHLRHDVALRGDDEFDQVGLHFSRQPPSAAA